MTSPSRTLPDPAAEPTITVKRTAAVLGISTRHAYVGVERGEIPSIKVGSRIVVPTARFLSAFFGDVERAGPSDNGSDGSAVTSGNGTPSHLNLTGSNRSARGVLAAVRDPSEAA